METANLERQRYRLQRITMLKELQKHLRERMETEAPEQFSNKEFSPDFLAPFIKD